MQQNDGVEAERPPFPRWQNWPRGFKVLPPSGQGYGMPSAVNAGAGARLMIPITRIIAANPPRDLGRVRDYAARLLAGEQLPPVWVAPVGDGTFILGDGTHRLAGRDVIEAINVGTRRAVT